jgi:hypothetical protein
MNKTKLFLLVSLGLLGGLIPLANADERDQKTIVTFSGPVEIPGHVLQAGTYVASGTHRFGGRDVREEHDRRSGGSEGVVLSRRRHRSRISIFATECGRVI